MRAVKSSTTLLIGLLLWSCFAPEECRPYKDFFRLDLDTAHSQFRRMPLDAQIDIHLCSYHQHPPGGYVYDLASSGKPAAYAIAARLERESNERKKAYLVEALEAIDDNHWRLHNDPSLMKLVVNEVSGIRKPEDKAWAIEYLQRIQARRGIPLPKSKPDTHGD